MNARKGVIVSDSKICKECGKLKSPDDFHKCGFNMAGEATRRSRCTKCCNSRRIEYDRLRSKTPKRILSKYKRDATRRGIVFSISDNYFYSLGDSSCHYCGAKLDRIRLDRINNSEGYVMGNVVPCCSRCNFFKGTLDVGEFLRHVKDIYLFQEANNNGE